MLLQRTDGTREGLQEPRWDGSEPGRATSLISEPSGIPVLHSEGQTDTLPQAGVGLQVALHYETVFFYLYKDVMFMSAFLCLILPVSSI